jgi:hypothetical protein
MLDRNSYEYNRERYRDFVREAEAERRARELLASGAGEPEVQRESRLSLIIGWLRCHVDGWRYALRLTAQHSNC